MGSPGASGARGSRPATSVLFGVPGFGGIGDGLVGLRRRSWVSKRTPEARQDAEDAVRSGTGCVREEEKRGSGIRDGLCAGDKRA